MKAFVKGFAYAFRGIGLATKGRNMRFHLVACVAVVVAGTWFHVSATQWLLLALCIAAVLTAETINTAVEATCDLIDDVASLGIDPRIRNIKDLAAGAVLLTAIGSAIIGGAIFAPFIF